MKNFLYNSLCFDLLGLYCIEVVSLSFGSSLSGFCISSGCSEVEP